MVITKLLIRAIYALGVKDAKFYGKAKERKTVNFVGKAGIFITISCLVIACGFVGMGMHKAKNGNILNYSLEFKGGTSTNVTFNEDLSMETIHSDVVPLVEEVTGDANVETQKVSGSNEVIIKTRTLSVEAE